MKQIIFINSHPIQYFAPLYQYLTEQGLPVSCWYCSDENVQGHRDRDFDTQVSWDIPILKGYAFRFFKNTSWKPSIYNGFFGLVNPSLILALRKEPKSIIIVHGWAYLTHALVILLARFWGHCVCLRGESPLNQEIEKRRYVLWLKQVIFRGFLFRFVHRFLYIGKENMAFYEFYGVQKRDLIFVPYAVDNQRFRSEALKLQPIKLTLRKELGLPLEAKIILYTAKYIAKKNPLDLLKAFALLKDQNLYLVMVGEGKLRVAMEDFIRTHQLQNIFLTGFINQSEIGKYYSSADVFVMCSGKGETWGLSVNEALNFSLPVVVTKTTGCSSDLVVEGQNGYLVEEGNPEELAMKIKMAFQLPVYKDPHPLSTFSFDTISKSLKDLVACTN